MNNGDEEKPVTHASSKASNLTGFNGAQPDLRGAVDILASCRHKLTTTAEQQLEQAHQALSGADPDWEERFQSNAETAFVLGKANAALRAIIGQPKDTEKPEQFSISELSLLDWSKRFSYPKAGKEEAGIITGLTLKDGTNVLTRLETLTYAKQTAARVSAHALATQKMLIILKERHDTELLATIHSHPGSGKDATTPSQLDIDTQERLETLGHRSLSIILAGASYVRFFTTGFEFKIAVHGKGYEILEEEARTLILRLKEGVAQ